MKVRWKLVRRGTWPRDHSRTLAMGFVSLCFFRRLFLSHSPPSDHFDQSSVVTAQGRLFQIVCVVKDSLSCGSLPSLMSRLFQCLFVCLFLSFSPPPPPVPAGSPFCGGDVTVSVRDINQPSLPTPFYSILVSVSVFVALSTVFHSTNSADDSLFSHAVFLVLFCLTGPFNYLSLYKSLPLSQP